MECALKAKFGTARNVNVFVNTQESVNGLGYGMQTNVIVFVKNKNVNGLKSGILNNANVSVKKNLVSGQRFGTIHHAHVSAKQ